MKYESIVKLFRTIMDVSHRRYDIPSELPLECSYFNGMEFTLIRPIRLYDRSISIFHFSAVYEEYQKL